MAKIFIADHPLIQHKLSILRDVKTGTKEFRALIQEITMLLCYEATRDFKKRTLHMKSPLMTAAAIAMTWWMCSCSGVKTDANYNVIPLPQEIVSTEDRKSVV